MGDCEIKNAKQRVSFVGRYLRLYSGIDNTAKMAIENPSISKESANNELTKQSPTVVERLKYIKPGQNVFTADIPEELQLKAKGAKISCGFLCITSLWRVNNP